MNEALFSGTWICSMSLMIAHNYWNLLYVEFAQLFQNLPTRDFETFLIIRNMNRTRRILTSSDLFEVIPCITFDCKFDKI